MQVVKLEDVLNICACLTNQNLKRKPFLKTRWTPDSWFEHKHHLVIKWCKSRIAIEILTLNFDMKPQYFFLSAFLCVMKLCPSVTKFVVENFFCATPSIHADVISCADLSFGVTFL
jgi:hypothetical protein